LRLSGSSIHNSRHKLNFTASPRTIRTSGGFAHPRKNYTAQSKPESPQAQGICATHFPRPIPTAANPIYTSSRTAETAGNTGFFKTATPILQNARLHATTIKMISACLELLLTADKGLAEGKKWAIFAHFGGQEITSDYFRLLLIT
jgi:hypothetical protein